MTGIPVLLALEGAPAEPVILATIGRASGVRIVRRCVDLADLLAVAESGQSATAVISAGLRRLDHEAFDRLRRLGVAVVVVVAAQDEAAERRIRMMGVADVVAVDATDADAGALAVLAVVRRGPLEVVPAERAQPPIEVEPPRRGRLVAVWGPTGAPGRTCVASYLAHELSLLGQPTLLADADTYGGAVAQLLGLLDEAPGIAAAARGVAGGELDLASLSGSAREAAPHLRVLTGIVRPDRWPELRRAALTQVWAQSRLLVDYTVVDCGFGLEQDEELSYDTSAPQRNAATLATLEDCDVLLAVGRADPIGVHRLIRALPEARKAAPTASLRVVLTRVRKSAVGSAPERQLRDSLERHAGADDVVLIPDDPDAFDKALRTGQFLAAVAPRSPARTALAGLARELAPESEGAGRRRRRSKAAVGT